MRRRQWSSGRSSPTLSLNPPSARRAGHVDALLDPGGGGVEGDLGLHRWHQKAALLQPARDDAPSSAVVEAQLPQDRAAVEVQIEVAVVRPKAEAAGDASQGVEGAAHVHLDRGLMLAFLEEVQSDLRESAATMPLVELGRLMHVIAGSSESPFPLNVGLLFFHPAPHRYFRGTQIDVVWFPEGPGASHFTEKEFRGPIHHIIRESLDYIARNYLSVTVIKHADRAEADRVSNFPLDAIEEALVNAMYHRAYDERNPVEVRIGRNELSVMSYPGPDRSVKLEALRAGRALPRRYRNRRIGEMLKELDLTEGRGTGISKIIGAMRKNGSPPPVFEFDENHDYFLVTLPVHPKAAYSTGEVTGEAGRGPTTTPVGGRTSTTGEVTGEVTAEVARLLGSLVGEMSRAELQLAVGLKHEEHFRDAYLKPAIALGLVEMTVPDKPRSSKQRYRRTAAGAAWSTGRGE